MKSRYVLALFLLLILTLVACSQNEAEHIKEQSDDTVPANVKPQLIELQNSLDEIVTVLEGPSPSYEKS